MQMTGLSPDGQWPQPSIEDDVQRMAHLVQLPQPHLDARDKEAIRRLCIAALENEDRKKREQVKP
jgi:energy-coupling factor transporter ATP-binding protein EcfA2